MREWHAKTVADKTFPRFRVYIQNEYTKQVKRNRSTAGSVKKGIANKATEGNFSDAEAQAMVIAEVANVLQAQNAEQMKNMMAMFEKFISSMPPTVTPAAIPPPKTPRQPHNECPHCKKKHANHDKCWELDANKALRPANWKSIKSAWRCPEDEPTEQWQPGKVEIHKIIKGFSYLVAAGPISPPTTEPPDPIKSVLLNEHAQLIVESADSPRPLSKVAQHWARRIENRNTIKDVRQADNQAFDNAIKEAMLDSGATSNFIQSADGFELTGPSSKTSPRSNRHP
jgi:hypothetical protein